MDDFSRLKLAEEFAREKHKGQYRKQGSPYIDHPIAVMDLLKSKDINDEDYLIAALFHDLLEDTDASEEEIIEYGNEDILEVVKLLTKDKNYNMEEYILNIGGNYMARIIKLADRAHNLKDGVNTNDEKFVSGYIKETEEYYVDLSKETVFEKEIDFNLRLLKSHFAKLRKGG